MNKSSDRIGEIRKNNYGSEMIITDYASCRNITVKFTNNNYTNDTTYDNFIKGKVRNPYDKTCFGIGFVGVGKYKPKMNGKDTIQYLSWRRMLQRCYDTKLHEKHPTYIGCEVIDEWHNFQTYAKWYDENYYKIEGERMNLDKDILVKGNKIYSPDTCIFVPQYINILFVKRNAKRGNLPIGVSLNRRATNNPFFVSINNQRTEFLGYYDTPEKAFYAYKKHKEYLIKHTAEQYKSRIPNELYNAMVRYEVEISD